MDLRKSIKGKIKEFQESGNIESLMTSYAPLPLTFAPYFLHIINQG